LAFVNSLLSFAMNFTLIPFGHIAWNLMKLCPYLGPLAPNSGCHPLGFFEVADSKEERAYPHPAAQEVPDFSGLFRSGQIHNSS